MSQLTLLGLDWHSSATLRKEEEGKTSNHRVGEDMNPSVWREPASSLLYARGGGGGMQYYYVHRQYMQWSYWDNRKYKQQMHMSTAPLQSETAAL